MSRLRESLLDAPLVEKEGYHYFVHPISDGIPALDPELLREIVVRIVREAETERIDKIVAPEAMGIHIATAVSLATDVPLVVVRKRGYGLDGERALAKETGYAESEMYVNDIDEGDQLLVLDDVLSTGGTLAALLPALEAIGATVVDTVVVIEKVGGGNELDSIDYDATALISVEVVDGELVIHDD